MPPRMTITALKRGHLNALNCGLFLVGAWLLLGGIIKVKGPFALLRHGALPFPPEYRQDVEKALKERCPSATEL